MSIPRDPRVVGMDVAEIQIDSTTDWTWRTTNAATARHLVGNKRPNIPHVAKTTCCLTSKLLPQPVTGPGCNLRRDSHADKLREPVQSSSQLAGSATFSLQPCCAAGCLLRISYPQQHLGSPQGSAVRVSVLSGRPPMCVALVEQRCELSSGP